MGFNQVKMKEIVDLLNWDEEEICELNLLKRITQEI